MLNRSSENRTTAIRDPHISRAELRARLHDPSLTIVNVLPAEAFRDGHIPNSINLPVGEIERCARDLLPNLDQEIAIYCASPT